MLAWQTDWLQIPQGLNWIEIYADIQLRGPQVVIIGNLVVLEGSNM
jgi:hypothetical protein